MLTDHVAKDGSPKVVARCSLPLTGAGVVDRIITDRAVFDVVEGSLILRRLAPDHTEDEIRELTGAEFTTQLEEIAA